MSALAQASRPFWTEQVTVSANIPARTVINAAGAVPANAAIGYGVTQTDVANGDIADVVTSGFAVIKATGTVTKGNNVELLQAATYTTKDSAGVANVTGAGVQNYNAGVRFGLAHSSGAAGDDILVEIFGCKT